MLPGTAKISGRGVMTSMHDLVAELDDRPHQFAVGLFEDALFLAGFEQRVHGLGGVLLFFGIFRLRQRGDGEQQAQQQRDRKDEIKERLQQIADTGDPEAASAGEENLRQQAVEDENQQNDLEDGQRNLRPAGSCARPRGEASCACRAAGR